SNQLCFFGFSNTCKNNREWHFFSSPKFHPSASFAQSLLCFSALFRLSGITFVPPGANPTLRARRRASVPASSFFFFPRIASPRCRHLLPVYKAQLYFGHDQTPLTFSVHPVCSRSRPIRSRTSARQLA